MYELFRGFKGTTKLHLTVQTIQRQKHTMPDVFKCRKQEIIYNEGTYKLESKKASKSHNF